jgi:hypothetical protein
VTEPEPETTQHSVDPEHLSKHASGNYENKGPEQKVHACRLTADFPSSNYRSQQDSTGNIRGSNPENGQLKMPRTCEVAWQEL